MLIDLVKNNLVVQNVVGWMYSLVPTIMEHNLGKYMALKKAFYLTALEQLEGDYLEFGVFTGSSFVFATRMHRKTQSVGKVKTRFFGFDSFEGFGTVAAHDTHPFYVDNTFRVNKSNVIRNIRKQASGVDVSLIEGYFEHTIAGKTPADYGIGAIRVMFIDCDLKDPARLALDFAFAQMQRGMILVLDDYFSYKGDPERGVAGAFAHFNRAHPELEWRRICDYGYGGAVFMLARA